MEIGPVQLLILGFPQPDFRGEILAELERLNDNETVRVLDSLVVYKDLDDHAEVLRLNTLSQDQAIEVGSKVGALIGLGMDGAKGLEEGAILGAAAGAAGVGILPEDRAWEIVDQLPTGSAAAVILLEHHWAVPLRNAVVNAGGFPVSDGFISPLDLIELGMITAEEADEVQLMAGPGDAQQRLGSS